MDRKDSTRFTFELPAADMARLREIAEQEHRTVSGEMRRLIELRIHEVDDQSEVPA